MRGSITALTLCCIAACPPPGNPPLGLHVVALSANPSGLTGASPLQVQLAAVVLDDDGGFPPSNSVVDFFVASDGGVSPIGGQEAIVNGSGTASVSFLFDPGQGPFVVTAGPDPAGACDAGCQSLALITLPSGDAG